MSHKPKDCELNQNGECIFCGRKQDKRAWLIANGFKLKPVKEQTNE